MPPPCASFWLAPDVASASLTRERVRSWLDDHGWPPDEAHDLVYAVSEAVTNAAEHAFRTPPPRPRPDPPSIWVDCRLHEHDDGREVRIVIRDNGCWKPADADRGFRGHGLTLSGAFVDTFRLATGVAGTTVELTGRITAAYPGRPRRRPRG
ncbi:ATP-binding protein [Pseudonocardia sp. RS010]|uniref:ATP-binding protein n=1 Tax=Pseudonocardia sp. RS010 TaxID=3385979 RepID=UPI00399F7AE5